MLALVPTVAMWDDHDLIDGWGSYPAERQDCAVFGVPDEEFGEALISLVEPMPGHALDVEIVRAHLRDHLASYKVPRSVTFIDELPKTGSGKVLKRELRAPFWAGRDSKV